MSFKKDNCDCGNVLWVFIIIVIITYMLGDCD